MVKFVQTFMRNRQLEREFAALLEEAEGSERQGERRSYADRVLFSRPSDYAPVPWAKRLAHGALSVLLSAVLAFQPVAAEVARAQVISDPAAPIQFRPGVTSSGNGTPLVNIVTPSFGGVSHNKFQSYDIDTRGLILNNSSLGGTSVIGGSVSGNPNLQNSAPARIIVNEVTGSRASTLNGPTEVFGAKADVVVANPNGISCVSCGFINAGRTTLTTGVPTPDYNTGAISYQVTRGTISISGTGLNAGNAPLGNIDLIGRQVEINGPISSTGQLRIRAGAINYDQNSDATTALAGAPAVTGYAVSSSAAGTITAGSVSVLSKDVDLGVKLAGDIATLDGHLIVQSAGDATLANAASAGDIVLQAQGAANFTGTAQAQGRITANGSDVNVAASAAFASRDAIVLQGGNTVTSAGTLQSARDTTLTANGAVNASGVIQAGGQAALEGDTVTANGLTVYGTEVTIIARSAVELNETGIAADGAIRVMATDISLGQHTGFRTDGLISLSAKHDFFTDSVLDYPNLVLSVRDNLGIGSHGALVQDDINYTLTGTIDNAGQIYGRHSTVLAAANLINETTGQIYGPNVTLNVTNRIGNLGLIVADDTFKAVAATLDNGAGGQIYATDSTYTITASLTNLGSILSDDSLKVLANGAAITNDGTMHANGDVTVAAGSYTAGSARAVLAGATIAVTVSGALVNNGRILSPETVTISAGSIENRADALVYGYGVTVDLTGNMNNAGRILSGADLTIDAGSGIIINSGAIQANGSVSLAAGGYTGASTAIVGGDIVIVTATGTIDNAGRIVGDDLLLMRAADLVNRAGGNIQSFDIGLALTGDITNAGTIQAQDLLNVAANNLTNSGTVSAYEISRPDPDNAASLASGITLAGTLVNSGTIQTVNNLLIATNGMTNAAGGTIQGKAIDLRLPGVLVNNGVIAADGLLAIRSGGLANAGTAANTARISAKYLQIDANGGAVDNGAYGIVQGSDSVTIRAATSNFDFVHANTLEQGQFNYGKDFALVLTGQGLTIDAGRALIVDGSLYLGLGGDLTVLGTIASRDDLALHSNGSIVIGNSDPNNPGGGEIFTRGNAEIVAGGDVTNYASVIQSLGSMYIEAGGTVTNTRTAQHVWLSGIFNPSLYIMSTGGRRAKKYTDYWTSYAETSNGAEIWADGDLVIKAGTVTNDASTIYAGNNLVIIAATVNNKTRDTGTYFKTIKQGGSVNIGKSFGEGWIAGTHQETTSAMIGNTALVINGTQVSNQGTLSGSNVRIDAQTLVNGITDPNRFTAPTRLPAPVIDLSRFFTGGSAGSVSNPITITTASGATITYLHGSPITGGANERGPGWILEQVGDTRGNLNFFADPTTEQRMITQALIEETGKALLDPDYRNAAEQQQALWQGTVDYLEAHPDVKLGDTLTDSQRAAVTEPIIWYHTVTIDGQEVLVPELILPEDRLAEWAKTNGGTISGDSIYLTGDFIHNTGSILAGQDLTIEAGTFINERRVTTIGGTEEYADWKIDYLQDGGVVSGDSVNIFTQGDLYNIGGSIVAGSELSLIAGGNIVIAPQTIEIHWEDGSKKNGGKVDDVVNHGGTVLSGGSAVLIAGGELDVIGSTVHADGDLTLAALTGDVNIVASVDVTDHTVNDDGKKTRDIHVRNNGSDVTAGGDLTIVSAAGDVTIQASHLGGDSITISAADTVHFATGTDEDIHTETGKTSNLITQTTYNNGHSEQRLVYDTMDIGPGGLSIEAQQVIVDYLESITNKTYDKKGNEQITGVVTQSPMDAIALVINNPGMGWLAQVTSDGSLNVSYNGQNLTNYQWDNDQTTLTPAAAALIAVVVSVVTAGAGSPIAAGITAAVEGAIGTGAVATAVASGITAFTSSVISGTIIGAINGDLDMGQVLLNALASGLSAGITQGVNNAFFPGSIDNLIVPGSDISKILNPTAIATTAGKIVVDSAISAGIRAALLGEDFGDSFLNSLKYNAVNSFIEPVGFKIVGDMDLGAGTISNALMHAVIGAAGGYLVNGIEGLEGGALGAFLGELALAGNKPNSQSAINNMRSVQQIIGGLASLVVGDASMSGADAAYNGFQYNYLTHRQVEKFIATLAQCNGDQDCLRSAIDEAIKLSESQNDALGTCGLGYCTGVGVAPSKEFDFNILTSDEVRTILLMVQSKLPEGSLTTEQIVQLTSLQADGFQRLTAGTGILSIYGSGDYNSYINVARCNGDQACERNADLHWAAEVIASAFLVATGPGPRGGGEPVEGSVANANFAQSAINQAETFSATGAAKYSAIAGVEIKTVDDLANAIRNGLIKPSQISVDYVIMADGTQLILNTRTSVALDRAGVPQSAWYGLNQTGVQVPGMPAGTTFNDLAAAQLARNKLPATGSPDIPKGSK